MIFESLWSWRAGGLYVEKASSVFKERIDGSMGFIFGGDSFRELPSQGLTERMDAGSSAFRQSPFVRWGWELHSLGGRGLYRIDSGSLFNISRVGRMMMRRLMVWLSVSAVVSAGLEYHFLPELLIHIDPYAALTSGICDFRNWKRGLQRLKQAIESSFFPESSSGNQN